MNDEASRLTLKRMEAVPATNIRVARHLGRSPGSLVFKLGNIGRLDPTQAALAQRLGLKPPCLLQSHRPLGGMG